MTAIPLGRTLLCGSSDLPGGLTRRASTCPAGSVRTGGDFLPIWSCSVWGLPCPPHCCGSGALLPHLFTLTPPFSSGLVRLLISDNDPKCRHSEAPRFSPAGRGISRGPLETRPLPCASKPHKNGGAVCFLWHFPSNGLEPILPDVIRHTALWSSDFPPRRFRKSSKASIRACRIGGAAVRSSCQHIHYSRCLNQLTVIAECASIAEQIGGHHKDKPLRCNKRPIIPKQQRVRNGTAMVATPQICEPLTKLIAFWLKTFWTSLAGREN